MNKLAGVILAAGLSTGLMGAFAASSSAAPTPPGSYPLGTELTGICLTNPEPLTEQIRTRFQVFKDGVWEPSAETENSALNELTEPPCTEKIESPGLYRIYVTHYYPGGGKSVEYFGPYQIGGKPNPCTGEATEITDVKTPNGGSTSLTSLIGEHFTANQVITADADVELIQGDGSRVALPKGAKIKLDGCSFSSGSTTPFIRFSLLLGKIWSKVVPNSEHMQVKTERTVNGIRGTIFWVAYAHGVSTLHVDRGSVSLSPVSGKGRWKTVIVTAGHTATQRGTRAPVVRRAPINLNPPF